MKSLKRSHGSCHARSGGTGIAGRPGPSSLTRHESVTRDARAPCYGRRPMENNVRITDFIIHASLCADCIAIKAGLPASWMAGALAHVSSALNIATTVRRCNHCLETAVVYRKTARG